MTMPEEPLYEEDLVASMPIRVRHWEQLEAYAENLRKLAAEREVYPAEFSDLAAYERSMEPLRAVLRERIGYPPPGCFERGGNPRLEPVAEDATATYYRCWIPVSPELETYGLYLVPKGVELPAPLVISQHGGGGTPEAATFRGGSNYHDMVRGAIAEGYVVFSPLQIFNHFSDQDQPSPVPADIRSKLDARLRLFGTSLGALAVAKISRALDTLLERPEVQPERVGMVGLSYGGFFTLYTMALEPRIKCGVSACYFNDHEPAMAADKPHAWADWRPLGRFSDLDDPEIVALICPRPLQAQVGRQDELFPVAGARKASVRAGEYYRRLGIEERFEFVDFEGGHEWHGKSAWPFLKKWL